MDKARLNTLEHCCCNSLREHNKTSASEIVMYLEHVNVVFTIPKSHEVLRTYLEQFQQFCDPNVL